MDSDNAEAAALVGVHDFGRSGRVYLVVIAGVALFLPWLWSGFVLDDYGHQVILRDMGLHPTMRPWALYDFGGIPPKDSPAWKVGGLPWWCHGDWYVRFCRPLTSLSLWLDHQLWPANPVGYHATNLVLFGLLLVAVYRMYLRLRLPVSTALLALWLFAASDSTSMPVGWLANRNSLLAALFGVVAVNLALPKPGHRRVSRGAEFAALGCAVLACLCKESGVVFFAVIAVGRMLLDRNADEGAARRIRLPAIAVIAVAMAVAYVLLLAWAGYGAKCDFYYTPWTGPAVFFTRLLALMTAGVTSLMVWFSIDGLAYQPHWVWPSIIGTAPFVLWAGSVVLRYARRHTAWLFLLLWVGLTMFPQAGAPLSERLLFLPSIGSAALLALFIHHVRRADAVKVPPMRHRLLAILLLIYGAMLSPVITAGTGIFTADLGRKLREAIISADVGPKELGQREVFLLNAPTGLIPFNAISTWGIEVSDWGIDTGDRDVRFWGMQFGTRSIRWTRIDDKTFDIETLDRPFVDNLLERVFRETADPPAVGERYETDLFQVQIMDVDETGLRRFRVTCPNSLDEPRYRFLTWRDSRLRHTPPPAIGESIDFPPVDPFVPFMP